MNQSVKAPTPIEQQLAVWSAGNYADLGVRLQIVGEALAETIALRPGEAVLDVAAGNGNFSLAAARRFADVTATDLVPELVEKARIRSLSEGLDLTCQVENAEALTFADDSFDVVASVFGVMFVQDHAVAAQELARVCKPRGRIGLAVWSAEGFIGQVFKVIEKYRAKAPAASPMDWSREEYLTELFPNATEIQAESHHYMFRHYDAERWVEYFSDFYGPLKTVLAGLDETSGNDLKNDLIALCNEINSDAGSFLAPAEYKQIQIRFC